MEKRKVFYVLAVETLSIKPYPIKKTPSSHDLAKKAWFVDEDAYQVHEYHSFLQLSTGVYCSGFNKSANYWGLDEPATNNLLVIHTM
jgi:hypothetical protein